MERQGRILIFAVMLSVLPVAANAATGDTDKTDGAAENSPQANCYRCGTVEAISQRIVPAGVNAYYAYNVHVRMDDTRLLRVVPAALRGTLDVGDRVQIVGGVIQPVPPKSKPADPTPPGG